MSDLDIIKQKMLGFNDKYAELVKLYESLEADRVFREIKFDGSTLTIDGLNEYESRQIVELFNEWEKDSFKQQDNAITEQIKAIESKIYLKMKDDRTPRCEECGVTLRDDNKSEYDGICQSCYNH